MIMRMKPKQPPESVALFVSFRGICMEGHGDNPRVMYQKCMEEQGGWEQDDAMMAPCAYCLCYDHDVRGGIDM